MRQKLNESGRTPILINGTPLANRSVEGADEPHEPCWQGRLMPGRGLHSNGSQGEGSDGRRRQLRTLLLTAADAARQSRRIPEIAGRMARPVGQAVRERISMLISAAG